MGTGASPDSPSRYFAATCSEPVFILSEALWACSSKCLSENRPRRGGQAHFAHRASQNEPVPAGSRIGSKYYKKLGSGWEGKWGRFTFA